jgi:hypothetical protein
MTGLAQLVRPHCPECSGALEWFSGIGAAADGVGVDLVNQFLEMLGVSADSDGLDFWRCRKCGEIGALAS